MRPYVACCFVALLAALKLSAHPMPHSLLLLDVRADGIRAQLGLPLKELQLVFPEEALDSGYPTLLERKGPWLDAYLLQHLHVTDPTGQAWTVTIQGKSVAESEQDLTGKYHELNYQLWLQAPPGATSRHFIVYYDVIMHQLVTHKLFLKISRDWYGGMTARDSTEADLGVLMVNPGDGSISPVVVNLDEGSTWKGFKTMVQLGMQHIAEGTDHLLFLFVLLLPAPLIAEGKRWTRFGGIRYSLLRLLKIVTAFTIGHSFSLILGALQWIVLPRQPVEVAIAFSILITALHAVRPILAGKEALVAVGFGLIHGLAFSNVLADMDLDGKQMALSILGFNIGIELMQLFLICCTVPWLIVLSKNNAYNALRLIGAGLGIVAALGWMAERITGQGNFLSKNTELLATEGKWMVLTIAVLAMGSFWKRPVPA